MVQFFGTVRRNAVEGGEQIITFRIPAFSRSMARRRAQTNARLKGFEDAQVSGIENVGSADIPGQNEYDVTITRAA